SYLSLVVLIPLSAVLLKTTTMGWSALWETIRAARVLASLKLTFGMPELAAVISGVFGLILAWVLVRYRFPGRRIVDARIDLPFALPTSVAGISLAPIYAPTGWIGSWAEPYVGQIAFTPWGVLIALVLIGLPIVLRTVQP